MFWLIVLTTSLISAVLLYSQRFKTGSGLTGNSLVQISYISIGILSTVAIIGILNQVTAETLLIQQSVAILLKRLILVSIFITTLGVLLHSLSLLVVTKKHSKIIEYIHLHISHYMIYIGGISTILMIGYVDLLSHNVNPQGLPFLAPFLGILIGFCCAISIIWSGFVLVTLIVSWISSMVFLQSIPDMYVSFFLFLSEPYASASIVAILTANAVLTVHILANFSSTRYRNVSRAFYPSGHRKKHNSH